MTATRSVTATSRHGETMATAAGWSRPSAASSWDTAALCPSERTIRSVAMNEIGWRLIREAWGHGYATEAARAALIDVFRRVKLIEVLAYTDAQNIRSQAVMRRLGLSRDASRDFAIYSDRLGTWRG